MNIVASIASASEIIKVSSLFTIRILTGRRRFLLTNEV
jgi:hypothetical protein